MDTAKRSSVKALLETIYPGSVPPFPAFRAGIEDVLNTPGPLAVLLEGPPGVGKSTAGRAIALGRALAMVSPQVHNIGPERGAAMVLENRHMSWYRDLSISGLSREFAETALFGIVPEGATNVDPRIGVVEQSMTNAGPKDTRLTHPQLVAAAKERGSWIPLITGGVVLLDEIGDAEEWIQLKLLRLLNGETVSRVQGEGMEQWSFTFPGVAVLATWKPLSNLRPDLLQRVRQYQLRVPGISEYPIDARTRVITSIVLKYQQRAREEISRLENLKTVVTASEKASDEWLVRIGQASTQQLTPEQMSYLSKQDWKELGEFRGLTRATMATLSGSDVSDAVDALRHEDAVATSGSEDDIDRLDRYLTTTGGVADGWKVDKLNWARRMSEALETRDPQLLSYLLRSGTNGAKLKKDLNNLLRATRRTQ